jgi:hypothetical protein
VFPSKCLFFCPTLANSCIVSSFDSIYPWARLPISKWLFNYSAKCSNSSMNYTLLSHQLPNKEIKSGSNTSLIVRGEEIRWRINRIAGKKSEMIEVYETFRRLVQYLPFFPPLLRLGKCQLQPVCLMCSWWCMYNLVTGKDFYVSWPYLSITCLLS